MWAYTNGTCTVIFYVAKKCVLLIKCVQFKWYTHVAISTEISDGSCYGCFHFLNSALSRTFRLIVWPTLTIHERLQLWRSLMTRFGKKGQKQANTVTVYSFLYIFSWDCPNPKTNTESKLFYTDWILEKLLQWNYKGIDGY